MSVRLRALLVSIVAVSLGTGGALAAVTTQPGVAAAAGTTYYLALGDSLAANAGANPASNSYVNRVYQHELTRFPGLVLNNISCGGATTGSMLTGGNCGRPVTQIVDAENFLHAHPGQVSFITIDIGGNDANGCVGAGGVNATCAANSSAQVQANLTTILNRLKAASPGIKVYGMNYYTPPLAFWLTGAAGQQVAIDSGPFAAAFNSLLTQTYAAAGFPTANVSAAFDNDNYALTGSYLGQTLPQNVANLCNWTLQCSNNDVHANNTGHGKIAEQFNAVIDGTPAPGALAVSTASLPAAHLGTPYSVQLTASGGSAPYRWTKVGKLPRGLKFGGGRRGTITGTPTKVGTSAFQVRVKDSTKPKGTAIKTLSIAVS